MNERKIVLVGLIGIAILIGVALLGIGLLGARAPAPGAPAPPAAEPRPPRLPLAPQQ